MSQSTSSRSAVAGYESGGAGSTPAQKLPEPWLRGTLTELPAITRAVIHALELADEDIERWCADLSDEEIHARPAGIAPVSFHLRHIVGSADRLLTYADGRQLSPEQLSSLKGELESGGAREELLTKFRAGLKDLESRVRAFSTAPFEEPRSVGRKQLPTTIGSLLIHVADHTQRHVGQAITTAKIVSAARNQPNQIAG